MIIAIPTDKNPEDPTVCPSFGRAPFFLFVNTQTGEKEFMENLAAASAGGAGIAAAQSIADKGADAVLTPRCGENAAKVLMAANIKLFKTEGVSVRENIDACIGNQLRELDTIHPGFHGHGG